jgi:hypothetical protein
MHLVCIILTASCCRSELGRSLQQLTQLQESLLSPSAAWRGQTDLAAAERLRVSGQKPMAAGLLASLGAGKKSAWNLSLAFTHIGASAHRCGTSTAKAAGTAFTVRVCFNTKQPEVIGAALLVKTACSCWR